MRSRDNTAPAEPDAGIIGGFSVRAAAEWSFRALSLIALLLSLWTAIRGLRGIRIASAHGGSGALQSPLTRWSTTATVSRAHVRFDSVPSIVIRAWISALSGAGTRMTWDAPSLPPAGIAVEPIADPRRRSRVWIAGPNGAKISLRDSLGFMDSVSVGRSGAVTEPPFAEGAIAASAGPTVASAALRDTLHLRPVLVLGAAGWETGFVTAALEEIGWKVDTRVALRPKADIVQGPPIVLLDTARYSAVIAIDSSAAPWAAAIAGYVRNGGGLIVGASAERIPEFAALLPAAAEAALPEGIFATDTLHPRTALALTPLVRLKPDAIALERSRGRVATAARRVRTGRVLQIGYLDSWRLQMGGPGDAVREFHDWWGSLVSSVAYAPRVPFAGNTVTDPLPVPALVDALGSPAREEAQSESILLDPRVLLALFTILMIALPLETASRRLRGKG